MRNKIILTGAAGFIGSHFVRHIATKTTQTQFLILDSLTYSSNFSAIENRLSPRLLFKKMDIRDKAAVSEIFKQWSPDGVIHFAAQTHVDRSLQNPSLFFETNLNGTENLLQASLNLIDSKPHFRFLQVSTDEVYGSTKDLQTSFCENSSLNPTNPYSESKALADQKVLELNKSHNLNAIITRSSNNYGPWQHPEKFIPTVILAALKQNNIPIYGDGLNFRDWLYVEDNIQGIWSAFKNGTSGEIFNLASQTELKNIDVAKEILNQLQQPQSLIKHVTDRKNHDWRYALNCNKAKQDLSWSASTPFQKGLLNTISWYSQKF